jgi:predicted dehydrogenase
MSTLQEIGIGIIGCGSMGREHAANLRTLPSARLVAISDPVEDARCRLMAEGDVPHAYASYHDLLERRDVDAVIITVPNALHRVVALDAIAAAKHVLLEKPLAHTLEDGIEIVRAAERSDRVVMLGFNNRFNPASQALRRAIAAGRLGSLYYARARWLRREGLPPQASWFTRKAAAGGGALIDIGVHMLDLAFFMLGHPRAVAALGITQAHFGPERARRAQAAAGDQFDVEDFAAGMITLAGGGAVQIETSWASFIGEGADMGLEFLGTAGGARWTRAESNGLSIYTSQDGDQVDITPRLPEADGHQEELRAFLAAIQTGSTTPVPVRDGLHILAIVDALYASSRSGELVPVPDTLGVLG